MNAAGEHILQCLQRVDAERRRRAQDAGLSARVEAVKRFQHLRFAHTYADFLASPRYARAARFFLDELYGPHDFTARDAQFARVVPALVRLFPADVVDTVAALAELHALSEALDSAMGNVVADLPLRAEAYIDAWQTVGCHADRERQIVLMLQVGSALDRLTRHSVLRHSLRLMRGPARAAGLDSLQAFLESGFDTFREMRGAAEFLGTVASRERKLASALFAGGEVPAGSLPSAAA